MQGLEKGLVSIVIPTYNAANFIGNILCDLINQTYRNIEIIVVDDASEDNTFELLTDFEKKDERIQVFKIEHSGPSKARNYGLQIVKGEFIRFIDADDRVPYTSIEKMVKPFLDEEIDLVIGNFWCKPFYSYYLGNDKKEEKFPKDDFAFAFAKRVKSFYFGVLWNKLYRTELIKNEKIIFDEDVSWCEDYLFNLIYYEKMRNCFFVNTKEYVYKYNINSGSITNTIFKSNKEAVSRFEKLCYERTKEFFEEYGCWEYVKVNWDNNFLYGRMIASTYTGNDKENLNKKYKFFLNVISGETVLDYINNQISDNKLFWKRVKLKYNKKQYKLLFTYLLFKKYMFSIMKRTPIVGKYYFQHCCPKEL